MNLSLIIGTFFPATFYGGPIYSTYYLSTHLAHLGVDVSVSTTNANGKTRLDVETGSFLSFGSNLKVKYYGWANSKSFSLPFLSGLWNDIADCDIVFLQPLFSLYVPVSLLYAQLLKKPVLLSPRGSLGEWCLRERSVTKRIWLKYFIAPFMSTGYWHATSDQERADIVNIFPKSIVSCIPNGIPIDEFNIKSEEPRDDFIFRLTKTHVNYSNVIVSMGRLNKIKGFDILIKSFSLIRNKLDAILLIAGGDAGERQFLSDLITELGLSNRVFLIGELSGQDKVDFFAKADLFALPSHHENFGNVYLEALAAGTPIIASTKTPWHEVEKVACGRCVEPTPDNFANAIIEILSNDYRAMGLRGKEYAVSNFGWEAVARQFQSLFDTILGSTTR